VTRPTFAPDELERSRTQAIDRLRVALRQPGPLASQVLARLAYGAAPYGAPASGTPASLGTLTRDEIISFHQQWWRPDNAALIVTGAMTAEEGFAFAEQALGGWVKPAGTLPTITGRAGEAQAARVVVIDLPGSGQASVSAAVRGPRRGDPAWYPLAVANAVMGGGSNGRLFQEVRARRGLSYGAYSALGSRAENALLTASTQTKNESAAEVVDLVLAEFARLVNEPVAETAVTDRETFLTGGFSRSIETTGGLGDFLADTVVYGLPLTEAEAYAQQIAATTPQTLQAAATTAIGTETPYVVVVGDTKLFIDALRARHPDLVLISSSELDLGSPTLGL
jgi:zinc protease